MLETTRTPDQPASAFSFAMNIWAFIYRTACIALALLLVAAVVAFEVARRSGENDAMYLFAVVFAVLAVVAFLGGRHPPGDSQR